MHVETMEKNTSTILSFSPKFLMAVLFLFIDALPPSVIDLEFSERNNNVKKGKIRMCTLLFLERGTKGISPSNYIFGDFQSGRS